MRWMETIRLQVGDGNRNKLEQTLAEIVQGACEGNMIEMKRYRHATVKNDWMILLRWESDGAEPQGSRTGRCLAHLLKSSALVSHSVWVEEEKRADAGKEDEDDRVRV